MEYCPYCSHAVTKPVKVCPKCKKNIDLELLANLVKPGETSNKSKTVEHKIWIREKMRLIIPVLTLIVGFIMGGILINMYNVVRFANEKSSFESLFGTGEMPNAFRYLIESPQVLLSPHVAGWSVESKERLARTIVDKIRNHYQKRPS